MVLFNSIIAVDGKVALVAVVKGKTMLTVIIVDDDTAICESLDALFAGEGYTVICVVSGERAVELLRERTEPAVVLFDYLMPHGDGLYLLQAVADDEQFQRCYAYICMAAEPRSRLPATFIDLLDRLGVTFVDKPFDVDILLQTVEAAHRGLVARLDISEHSGGDITAQ